MLGTTHRQFIDSVRRGCGDRLKVEGHSELFSGLAWPDEQALRLGLTDGLDSASYMVRKVVEGKKIENHTVQESPFGRFVRKFDASVAERLALWMGWQGLVLC